MRTFFEIGHQTVQMNTFKILNVTSLNTSRTRKIQHLKGLYYIQTWKYLLFLRIIYSFYSLISMHMVLSVQNSSHEVLVRSFQLAFSLRDISLGKKGKVLKHQHKFVLQSNSNSGYILCSNCRITATIALQIPIYSSHIDDPLFIQSF